MKIQLELRARLQTIAPILQRTKKKKTHLGQVHFDTIPLHDVIAAFQIVHNVRLELTAHDFFDVLANFLEALPVEVFALHHAQALILFGDGRVLFDGRLQSPGTALLLLTC